VSSFYGWAVIAEEFEGENPMRRRLDVASLMTPSRRPPFTGGGVCPEFS
jgi:hypothetical protein